MLEEGKRQRGSVVWFNDKRGLGFIAPDVGGKDVFVHFQGINMEGFKKLEAEQRVEFSLGTNDKGVCAVDVEVLDEKTGE